MKPLYCRAIVLMVLEVRPLPQAVFSHWLSLSWNTPWHLWCLVVSSLPLALWSIKTAVALTALGYRSSKDKGFFPAIQPLKQFSSKFSRHLQGQTSGLESWAQGDPAEPSTLHTILSGHGAEQADPHCHPWTAGFSSKGVNTVASKKHPVILNFFS